MMVGKFVVRPSRPHIVDCVGIVRARRPHHKSVGILEID
jgi:hypothetical protein